MLGGDDADIDAHHAVLQGFGHAVNASHIATVKVTGQTKFGIVGGINRFLLCGETKHRCKRTKGFFLGAQHAGLGVGDDGGLEKLTLHFFATGQHTPALLHSVSHMALYFFHCCVLDQGALRHPIGKAITGACNLAFLILAVSGLYLWWPRKWRTKGLRRSIWFIRRPADAKARDWNWHNVIGFWSAPVLIVLTLTALPISYRWAGNLIFTLTGTPPPPPTSAPAPTAAIPAPVAQAQPLSADSLIARAQKELPAWTSLTYRGGSTGAAPTPATMALRTADAWPRTALTTLSLDPFTGEILKTSSYANLNAAQRVRSWTRFLHTGEALGALGQAVAALASLGGCVLVYTGFALAWHRWRRWRNPPPLGAS